MLDGVVSVVRFVGVNHSCTFPFFKKQIVDLLTQTCHGMEYLHAKDIIHRDLKRFITDVIEDTCGGEEEKRGEERGRGKREEERR